jgi:hypothetical protein
MLKPITPSFDYASAKLPARPVPNAKVIEAYIEEFLLQKSGAPRM